MAWFVVIATLMFLYGSFLMVRPSPRQRQIAAMRQSAIGLGLDVRLASRMKFPEELSRMDMACLLSSRPEGESGKSGTAFKNPDTGKIRSYGVFAAMDDALKRIFDELPSGAEAIVSSEQYVGVCWDEKGDEASVEKIASSMKSIEGLTALK